MAKRSTRRPAPRRKVSPTRQAALDERRELKSARDLQRQIKRLARELARAVTQADDALIGIVRMVHDREQLKEDAQAARELAGV